MVAHVLLNLVESSEGNLKQVDEMPKSLSDLFEEARASCVEWDGEPLFALHEMPAPSGFLVEFLRSKPAPVQGLNLKAYGGVLRINDVEARDMLLWVDTAPERVTVTFKPRKGRNAILKIWNIWRGKMGGHDVTHAWLGNAAMRVEQAADGKQLLLRCSDGEGPVDFGDLEARVTVT